MNINTEQILDLCSNIFLQVEKIVKAYRNNEEISPHLEGLNKSLKDIVSYIGPSTASSHDGNLLDAKKYVTFILNVREIDESIASILDMACRLTYKQAVYNYNAFPTLYTIEQLEFALKYYNTLKEEILKVSPNIFPQLEKSIFPQLEKRV